MKRFRGSVLFLALAAVPLLSYAAGLVPCGGHDEPACQTCFLVQLINGVIAWLVMILGTVAAIIIVYAGFKLVTSGGNKHAKEEAKSLITNLIIGYVIVLAGWLLIDTGMKMLLIDGETRLGMWNQLSCQVQPGATTGVVTSNGSVDVNVEEPGNGVVTWPTGSGGGGGDSGMATNQRMPCTPLPNGEENCVPQQTQCRANGGIPTINNANRPRVVMCNYPQVGAGGGGGGSGGGVQCSPSNSACSVSALMAAGLTSRQANVMSCIAMTESSGIPSTPPFNETNPNARPISTACGTFQITRTTWRGNPPPGACNDWRSNCQRAQCNIQMMVRLVRANGYSDWTCPNCNNRAASCVRAYGG